MGQAWSNQVVSRVIIAGTKGQELVYDQAPPAFGHLIGSILGANFTDPYGNLGLSGITAYGNISIPAIHFIAVELTTNGTYISTSTTEAGPWTQIARVIYFESLTHSTANTGLLLSNDVSAAKLLLTDVNDSAGKGVIVALNSYVTVNDPNATQAVEGWHTMSGFLNSWAATTNTPRYKLGNNNNVLLDGAMDATSATASTFFTIPAAYRPVSPTKLWAAGANAGVIAGQSPFIQVATTGSVAALGLTLPTAGAHVTITGSYPLD